tara:strand:+ start:5232 stop:5375 length:144 start_codon:yes stop_codon:yes gene_type:complete
MKRDLYENWLLVWHIGMTMGQVNSLDKETKAYYVNNIEQYLSKKETA